MKLERRSGGSGSAIGVEIGAHAVRAVEVTRGRRGLGLRRFAHQVLPAGAVIDGEVKDVAAVASALRQLWAEGGFGSRQAVLSVSGQRVIVRQAEVVSMSAGDFSSALQYQATDLIPLPIDHSVLDFAILPSADQIGLEPGKMRVLLAAAHRDVVTGHLQAARDASLTVVGLDASPIAAIRAVHQAAPSTGASAMVQLGDDVAVIAVQDHGSVRFSRILSIPQTKSSATEARSITPASLVGGGRWETTSTDRADASEATQSEEAAPGIVATVDVESLVTEVLGSLSFFSRQMDGRALDEVVISGDAQGGPVLTELERRLPYRVTAFDALAGLDLSAIGADQAQRKLASATGLLAVGAAEWCFEPNGRRLSLLPKEIIQAAATKRVLALVAVGGLVVVAGLGALTVHQRSQVHSARTHADQLLAGNTALQAKVAALTSVSSAHAAVAARVALVRAAEVNDIAWSPLLAEIAAAMPAGTTLTNIAFTDNSAPSGGSSTGGSSASSASTSTSGSVAGGLGSVSMSVEGTGSEDEVAVWLRALSHVKGLSSVWVPSGSAGSGKVTFSSTASVTPGVPLVHRTDVSGGVGS